MNELRRDYILDEWVIIATERAKRPHDYKREPRGEIPSSENCHFCPGKEENTPRETGRIERDGQWIARSFFNKYPIATPEIDTEEKPSLAQDNEIRNVYGHHEVLVETNKHGVELEDLEVDEIMAALVLARDRISAMMRDENVRVVFFFKNKGKEAGASVCHSHSQILALNLVPPEWEREIEKIIEYKLRNHACPYCRILEREMKSPRRIIDGEHLACFAPFASKFSMQARIMPKRHVNTITLLHDEELRELASVLKEVLSRLGELGDIPYNIVFRELPYEEDYHLYIDILPRINKLAGLELGSGLSIVVNPVPPEEAARFYRRES